MAVLADPVFSRQDPRATGGSSGSGLADSCKECARSLHSFRSLTPFELHRLGATRREAELIARRAQPREVLQALGFDARVELVLDGRLAPYRVLHFATHALFNDEQPELSSLVLSLVDESGQDLAGFLLPQHILRSRFGADLAVLSACNTALGKDIRGEGIVGMTRAFIHAGVPGVLASLWPVENRATVALMDHFYRALVDERASPSAALAEAQRELLTAGSVTSPRDWAGFVFQGDWTAVPFR